MKSERDIGQCPTPNPGFSRFLDSVDISETDERRIDRSLLDIVDALPLAFRQPGLIAAHVSFQDKNDYGARNFKKTKWMLSEHISVDDKKVGSIKVCYLSTGPEPAENPFSREEHLFLKTISKLLGLYWGCRLTRRLSSEREQVCQVLLMNSPNPVNVINPDCSLEYINPAMEDLTGFTLPEVIGKRPPFPWWPEERAAKIKNDLTEAMHKGGVYKLEELYKTKKGRFFYVEVTSKPAYRGKDFIGLVCNWVDITQRKKAEEALENSRSVLQKQKLALERKNVALGEIIEQIEREKTKIKDNIRTNLEELMLPILEKLKMREDIRRYAVLLESQLEGIISSYGAKITDKRKKLTPREIELCNMIKGRLATKDISRLLNVSETTIEKHRNNIRKKLGISKKKINLASYLSGL